MLLPTVFIVKPDRALPGSPRGRVIKAMSGVCLKGRIQEPEFRSQEVKVKNLNYREYEKTQKKNIKIRNFFARSNKIK
jgi:hypothetical protein